MSGPPIAREIDALVAEPSDGPFYAAMPGYAPPELGEHVGEQPGLPDHPSAGDSTDPFMPDPVTSPDDPYELAASPTAGVSLGVTLQITGSVGASSIGWGDGGSGDRELSDSQGKASHVYAAVGEYEITAWDGTGEAHRGAVTFEAKDDGGAQAPTLESITPDRGETMATTDVTLAGKGFTSPGAKPQTSTDGTNWEDASFKASPAVTDTSGKVALDTSAAGVLQVRVNAEAGASPSKDFTVDAPAQAPQLDSLTPASAPQA